MSTASALGRETAPAGHTKNRCIESGRDQLTGARETGRLRAQQHEQSAVRQLVMLQHICTHRSRHDKQISLLPSKETRGYLGIHTGEARTTARAR